MVTCTYSHPIECRDGPIDCCLTITLTRIGEFPYIKLTVCFILELLLCVCFLYHFAIFVQESVTFIFGGMYRLRENPGCRRLGGKQMQKWYLESIESDLILANGGWNQFGSRGRTDCR